MSTEKKERKVVVVEGKVVRNFFGKTKISNDEKYRVTMLLDKDNITTLRNAVKENETYKDSGKKMTPKWFSESEEDGSAYVNLTSGYPIPVKDENDDANSLDEMYVGARVKVSINLREGAIYPKAFLILENGEEYNPFEDLEE